MAMPAGGGPMSLTTMADITDLAEQLGIRFTRSSGAPMVEVKYTPGLSSDLLVMLPSTLVGMFELRRALLAKQQIEKGLELSLAEQQIDKLIFKGVSIPSVEQRVFQLNREILVLFNKLPKQLGFLQEKYDEMERNGERFDKDLIPLLHQIARHMMHKLSNENILEIHHNAREPLDEDDLEIKADEESLRRELNQFLQLRDGFLLELRISAESEHVALLDDSAMISLCNQVIDDVERNRNEKLRGYGVYHHGIMDDLHKLLKTYQAFIENTMLLPGGPHASRIQENIGQDVRNLIQYVSQCCSALPEVTQIIFQGINIPAECLAQFMDGIRALPPHIEVCVIEGLPLQVFDGAGAPVNSPSISDLIMAFPAALRINIASADFGYAEDSDDEEDDSSKKHGPDQTENICNFITNLVRALSAETLPAGAKRQIDLSGLHLERLDDKAKEFVGGKIFAVRNQASLNCGQFNDDPILQAMNAKGVLEAAGRSPGVAALGSGEPGLPSLIAGFFGTRPTAPEALSAAEEEKATPPPPPPPRGPG